MLFFNTGMAALNAALFVVWHDPLNLAAAVFCGLCAVVMGASL